MTVWLIPVFATVWAVTLYAAYQAGRLKGWNEARWQRARDRILRKP